MKLFSVIALLLAVVASAQQPTWSSCAPGPNDMTVTSFSVTPYPLCVNQNMCITATGTLHAPVTAPTKLAILGKCHGRIGYTDNQDFCAILSSAGTPCPVPITLSSLTLCVLVKPSIPSDIMIQMTFQAVNGNGRILFCQAATLIATNCP
ncbi:hypothetical protein BGZ52_006209 [Haplosporangium bisporale]|nr:hypothetical protein BGZ52_006209 [Haplosporangium bisporale]KFH73683.1 hypothetical protein MVEG_00897 [Podila verticillata NRRL 6337]